MEEQTLEEKLNANLQVLSAVIGKPITLFQRLEGFNGVITPEIRFDCHLNFGDEYKVNLWQILKKESYMGDTFWGVDNAGNKLVNGDGKVISRNSYSSSESYSEEALVEDSKSIHRIRTAFLLKEIKGMDVESPAFMDYESYTLESLKGDDSYFRSVYLAIMCSLKERGINLPPILCKSENIREAMYRGDTETLDFILNEELEKVSEQYGQNMLKHSELEADEIKRFAFRRKLYLDRSVPLIEKIDFLRPFTVPGNNSSKKYNVLVVEDFGDPFQDRFGTIDLLGEKVAKELSEIGGYEGTNIFSTFNICDCLEVCGTGQIDAILMDGGHFLLGEAEEIMMMEGLKVGVSQNHESTEIPNLDGYGEKSIWRNKIYDLLERRGYDRPPCLIVPKGIMKMATGKFVDDMLSRAQN
ncbi:Uncharacterised protein [uncultured archaeon]|nr:Uncharacterised protein [uncultured archaeon]